MQVPSRRPTSRGFVQSGFYEVALTTHAPGPFSHATSQSVTLGQDTVPERVHRHLLAQASRRAG